MERDRPGVSVGKHEDKMGIRSSNTTDVVFDEVRVPADHMIGAEGTGFKTLMKMLSRTRPTGVAPAVGVAQRALDLAIEYPGPVSPSASPSASWRAFSSSWRTWR